MSTMITNEDIRHPDFDYEMLHDGLRLQHVPINKIDVSHICESSSDEEEDYSDDDEKGNEDGLHNTDAITKLKVVKKFNSDNSESDEDDDDDSDEVDELLEETLFALQTKLHFFGRILCHNIISVYKEIDKKSEQLVCVKLVARRRQSNREQSIPIEVRILACIYTGDDAHPGKKHLQQLVDFYTSPNSYVIVSKLEKESSFRCTLFNRPDDIRIMMRQLLQAVSYLHAHGIISRDIKPSNILWDATKLHLILCDFDLATFDTATGHDAVLGTDGFIAPEILAFEAHGKQPPPDTSSTLPPKYTRAVDIFSTAVVFASLLFNVRESEVTPKIITSWRKRLKRQEQATSTPAKSLLYKMLQLDPTRRPSADECLASDYFANGTSDAEMASTQQAVSMVSNLEASAV